MTGTLTDFLVSLVVLCACIHFSKGTIGFILVGLSAIVFILSCVQLISTVA